MPDIHVPDLSQDAIDRIDAAATRLGLSRDEYLRRMLEENPSPASERLSTVDEWLNVLDELLAKPLPARADGTDKDLPHHVDLRVSQEFWDDESGEEDPSIDFDFDADRARLAAAITKRYGPPRRIDIRPYAQDRPHLGAAAPLTDLLGGRTLLDYVRPGWTLLNYLTDWFTEVDLWTTGERGIVLEVGQVDREFPLQLMLVVGDFRDSTGPTIGLREESLTTAAEDELRHEPPTTGLY